MLTQRTRRRPAAVAPSQDGTTRGHVASWHPNQSGVGSSLGVHPSAFARL